MPRFDVDRWCADVRRAIDAADMDSLVPLLYENDPNGIFSWEDFSREYDGYTRKEWFDGNIECAKQMLEDE